MRKQHTRKRERCRVRGRKTNKTKKISQTKLSFVDSYPQLSLVFLFSFFFLRLILGFLSCLVFFALSLLSVLRACIPTVAGSVASAAGLQLLQKVERGHGFVDDHIRERGGLLQKEHD